MDMANPFEEMFRGNYKNPPPESKGREQEQFAEINESEEVRLLEAAKMKAEGIILYAPLTEEVKEVFLAKLSEISDGALSDLRYELNPS
jgi:hypothetical protein